MPSGPTARRTAIPSPRPLAFGLAAAGPLVAAGTPAFAHLNAGLHGSFHAGLSHPFLGLDHVVALIAAGLWGAVLGGPARFALPTAHVGGMLVGFILLLLGVPLPLVEVMVPASLLILGLLVVLMVRLPWGAAVAVVAFFALFHGQEHSAALGSAGTWAFASGFMAAAALLQACGLIIACGFAHGLHHAWLVRAMGGAATLGGLGIMVGG